MGLAMCEHLYVVFTLSQPVVSFVQSSQFTDENYFFNSRSHYTKHPWGLDQVKGRLAITGLITYLRVWPNSWNLIMNISSKVLGRSPSNFVLSIFDLLEMLWYGRWSRDLCCFCMHGNIRDKHEHFGGMLTYQVFIGTARCLWAYLHQILVVGRSTIGIHDSRSSNIIAIIAQSHWVLLLSLMNTFASRN